MQQSQHFDAPLLPDAAFSLSLWRRETIGGGLQGALGMCFERSRQLCLQRYEKPVFCDTDYLQELQRNARGPQLGAQQLAAFAALFAWRDRVAREVNASTFSVLSRNILTFLAQSLPATVKEVNRCANGNRWVSNRAQEVRHRSALQMVWNAVLSHIIRASCPTCCIEGALHCMHRIAIPTPSCICIRARCQCRCWP